MGCLCSQPFVKPPVEVHLDVTNDTNSTRYQTNYLHPLATSPIRSQILSLPSTYQITENGQSRVELYIPIYVATSSYSEANGSYIPFKLGDEMELIEEIDSSQLRVNHLRTGNRGIVRKNLVRLDTTTPLRLAVKDAGIIQRCLMQYDVPGGYLIRRSSSDPGGFVLSISQHNIYCNTFHWHYFIAVNRSNNRFYFAKETLLKDLSFSSFQELIKDKTVRKVIPITEILPHRIEFEKDIWRIRFDQLVIQEKVGQGHFSEVLRGIWQRNRNEIPVAIKKFNRTGLTSEMKQEIEVMKNLANLYIVTLYGISENPVSKEVFIVTEFMKNGDLKSWLKKLPTLPEDQVLLQYAQNIVKGMYYLESHNYVHRDLACRNILLGPKGSLVKIADFGLTNLISANDQTRRQKAYVQKLPIAWLAPEVMDDRAAYSVKSDVWAFGIVLIELWLKGEDPYNKKHVAWIQSSVSTGYVHEKPFDCPTDFYESIIYKCLSFEPQNRPSFLRLRESLEKYKFKK